MMSEKVAIVVVTYKRQQLLAGLLGSFLALTAAPWRVVVVDNENSPATERLVRAAAQEVAAGNTRVPWPDGADSFVYAPQARNTGGSGGFSAGVRTAYDLGADWFWLMDDDVEVVPRALERLAKWMPGHGVVQGSRLDYDGGPFYWQYRFIAPMAIYNPVATAKFGESGAKKTNTACFEGGLFSRAVVDEIGFPDDRFFIYWDDCIYGYLASQIADSVAVSDVILKRSREVRNWEVTGVRQLNSSSDMTRFYIMRNRGYMARYLQLHGDYNPVLYSAGTVLSFAKEFIRLAAVDRDSLASGSARLVAGWKESRELLHDPTWKPMPKPSDQALSIDRPGENGEPVVSVIVPIYNVERYLDQALASVENQTLRTIEIICVNDGSTDGSPDIIRAHAARDSRIRVIDKPNGGYGSAMNCGLDAARGTWVAILEPDDWCDEDMLRGMAEYASQFGEPIDIVRAPYWSVWPSADGAESRVPCSYKGLVRPSRQPFTYRDPAGAELLAHHPSVWSALYRRAFLNDRAIRFPEIPGAGWADNPFLVETHCQARSIAYLDKPFYNYREESPEKAAESARRNPMMFIARWNDMQDILDRLGIDDVGVKRAQVKRAFNYIGRVASAEGLESGELRDAVAGVFARLDDDLVFSSEWVSPEWKRRYAEVKGVELPGISPFAYRANLVATAVHKLRITGVRHTISLVRRHLSCAQ